MILESFLIEKFGFYIETPEKRKNKSPTFVADKLLPSPFFMEKKSARGSLT
jgi:hypothetical protein